MNNFECIRKVHIVFGRDSDQHVGMLIKQHMGKRVLIHYGNSTLIYQTLLDRVKKSLDRSGIFYIDFYTADVNPGLAAIEEGVDLCKRQRIDFILAIGDNAVVNRAKAIAAGFFYDSSVINLFLGMDKILKALPIATILTTSGTGGENGAKAFITYNEGSKLLKYETNSNLLIPILSVLNPEFCYKDGLLQIGLSVSQIIAQIMSYYLTPTDNCQIVDSVSESILSTCIHMALRLKDDFEDYEARANLMWAGTLAHSDLNSAGRDYDPSINILALIISTYYNVSDGIAYAIIVPAYLEFMAIKCKQRLFRLAQNVFNITVFGEDESLIAANTVKSIRNFYHKFELPLGFIDIDGSGADTINILNDLKAYLANNVVDSKYIITDTLSVEAMLAIMSTYRN